ncbi:helix-turn-helix domain-containing protein [Sphingomonas sp. RS6]
MPIPVLHFDAATLPEGAGFGAWSAAIPTHRVTRIAPANGPFKAVVDAWTLGDLVVTHSRIDATRQVRTIDMLRQDGCDFIQILFVKSGLVTFSLDGQGERRAVRQGEVVMFDTLRPVTAETSPLDCITCAVARRVFTAAGFDPLPFHGTVIDGPWGRLVVDYLLAFIDRLPQLQMGDAPALADALASLIVTALRARNGRNARALAPSATPLRQRAEAYIEQNLTSPTLSTDVLARELAASRATLYRAFADVGGITAYLRCRRLEVIHARLNSGDRRTIGELAQRYGFKSAAHFSRTFRAQFGFCPRKTRKEGSALLPVLPASEVALFRHWEDQLR